VTGPATHQLPLLTGSRRCLFILEQAFTVLALFIFSRALVFHIFGNTPGTGAASPVANGDGHAVISRPGMLWIYLAIYGITGLLTIGNWRQILYVFYREKFIALLLALAALSSLWSVVPLETLAKFIAMSGCTVFAYYFASRYSPLQQLRLMAAVLALVMIASFATAILYPDIGTMQGIHQGLWRGAFTHKNMLGTTIPLASISFFLLAASSRGYTFVYWTGFCLALILLILSCSKSALASYCVIFSTLALYLICKKQHKLGLIALASVIIAAGSFCLQYMFDIFPPIVLPEIAAAVAELQDGKEWFNFERILATAQAGAPMSAELDTGQGRLTLWALIGEKIAERPWLGYGLGGFWLGEDGPSGSIWEAMPWQPPSGHNGLLDLCLHLGVIGLGLFLVSFCIAGYKLIKPLINVPMDPVKLFAPTLLAYVILANIGESDLFSTNYILWICFVASVVSSRLYYAPASGQQTCAR
jgi:exopolysaccharide production protein ExoQ